MSNDSPYPSPERPPTQVAGSYTFTSDTPPVIPPSKAGLYRPPIAPSSTPELAPSEDKQWATIAHLGGVAGFIPSLVIYLIYGKRGRFARQESAEALNFHLTIFAAYIVCAIFSLIPIVGLLFSLCIFGLWIANIVLSILAGMSANRGEPFRYPLPVRTIT
ncbi:DUF4870 domain-containing protein [Arthrobacter sp. D2-10]